MLQQHRFFVRRTDCHNQSADWFRNDVRFKRLHHKLEIERERKKMNANEAIEYIHSVFWKGSVPGLSRTQELLEKMGNPQDSLKYLHIAGTNGKGSTASMTASILRKAGYRTGLYTSPYIYRFHERMQVDGE